MFNAEKGWLHAFESSFISLVVDETNKTTIKEGSDKKEKFFNLLNDKRKWLQEGITPLLNQIYEWCEQGNWAPLQQLSHCRGQLNNRNEHEMVQLLSQRQEKIAQLQREINAGTSDRAIYRLFFDDAFLIAADNPIAKDNIVFTAALKGRLSLVKLFKTFGVHLPFNKIKETEWDQLHDTWAGTVAQRKALYETLLLDSGQKADPSSSTYEKLIRNGFHTVLQSKIGRYFYDQSKCKDEDVLSAALASKNPKIMQWVDKKISSSLSVTDEGKINELLKLARQTGDVSLLEWLYKRIPALNANGLISEAFNRQDKKLIQYWLLNEDAQFFKDSRKVMVSLLQSENKEDKELGCQIMETFHYEKLQSDLVLMERQLVKLENSWPKRDDYYTEDDYQAMYQYHESEVKYARARIDHAKINMPRPAFVELALEKRYEKDLAYLLKKKAVDPDLIDAIKNLFHKKQ